MKTNCLNNLTALTVLLGQFAGEALILLITFGDIGREHQHWLFSCVPQDIAVEVTQLHVLNTTPAQNVETESCAENVRAATSRAS